MNLLISIFGGMLLTAILYAAGRTGRLSNYWAGVIAAAIPTFAYLAYTIGHPVGLDRITLHVIAYPTVSVLLVMLNGDKTGQARKGHWAPKLLIGFFLFMLVIMASFVYIAGQGLPPALARLILPNATDKNIHTGFAGVVEHKPDAAKGIGQHLRMEDRLARLGWQVEVSGLAGLHAARPGSLTVQVRDRDGQPVEGLRVAIELSRPGQPDRLRIDLNETPDGYGGTLNGIAAGVWVARLSIENGTEEIVLEHAVEVD